MINETDLLYCPACATPFGKLNQNVFICPNCKLHHYINPKPTNAIILENKKGEILFVVRALDPHKGMLDLPGGFLDINETLEDSVRREVREELGIEIGTFSYVSSFHDEYEHGGLRSRTVCVLYRGELPEGVQIHPSDDAESYVMIPKSNIPFEDMAFQGMKQALKDYLGLK